MDLRKVAGEANPADLFTKHSLTRERLINLTGLFECEFKSGRAESAPKVRETSVQKLTMADVIALAEEGKEEESADTKPIMPHRVYDEAALNYLYPSLEAVEPVDDEDDIPDPLLERGLEVAKEIIRDAEDHGRRRRPQK